MFIFLFRGQSRAPVSRKGRRGDGSAEGLSYALAHGMEAYS